MNNTYTFVEKNLGEINTLNRRNSMGYCAICGRKLTGKKNITLYTDTMITTNDARYFEEKEDSGWAEIEVGADCARNLGL